MKLEIKTKRNCIKYTSTQKLKNTLLKEEQVTREIEEDEKLPKIK